MLFYKDGLEKINGMERKRKAAQNLGLYRPKPCRFNTEKIVGLVVTYAFKIGKVYLYAGVRIPLSKQLAFIGPSRC